MLLLFIPGKCCENSDVFSCLHTEINFTKTNSWVPWLCCTRRGRFRYVTLFSLTQMWKRGITHTSVTDFIVLQFKCKRILVREDDKCLDFKLLFVILTAAFLVLMFWCTGGYGTVYRVKRKNDDQLFAIKCILPFSSIWRERNVLVVDSWSKWRIVSKSWRFPLSSSCVTRLTNFIPDEQGTLSAGPLEKTTPEYVNHEIKMLQKVGYVSLFGSFGINLQSG